MGHTLLMACVGGTPVWNCDQKGQLWAQKKKEQTAAVLCIIYLQLSDRYTHSPSCVGISRALHTRTDMLHITL